MDLCALEAGKDSTRDPEQSRECSEKDNVLETQSKVSVAPYCEVRVVGRRYASAVRIRFRTEYWMVAEVDVFRSHVGKWNVACFLTTVGLCTMRSGLKSKFDLNFPAHFYVPDKAHFKLAPDPTRQRARGVVCGQLWANALRIGDRSCGLWRKQK